MKLSWGFGFFGIFLSAVIEASALAPSAAQGFNAEIKFTVKKNQTAEALRVLAPGGSNFFRRKIYFFDTPHLKLFRRGLVARARLAPEGTSNGVSNNATIKIRPLSPDVVRDHWFKLKDFKCEHDRVQQASAWSCSLTSNPSAPEIDRVVHGQAPIESLFTKEQRLFAQEFKEWGTKSDLNSLTLLGPVFSSGWDLRVAELSQPIRVELWQLPDGVSILEVSTRVPLKQAKATQVKLVRFLKDRSIDPSDQNETKTRLALEKLVQHL